MAADKQVREFSTLVETTDPQIEEVVPVVEEQLQVGKRQVVASKVKLVKTVEERLETVTIPLQKETLEVKRVPVNEVMSQPVGSRQEGDTLIIPVFEEVVVVEKRYRLLEEIHITTHRTVHDEVQEVVLRAEKVRLERNGEEVEIEEKV
jgi:uncharacterized protein (TIGR02271 family)